MYLRHSSITGDFSKGATPVLIPNTEVKTLSAEYTCLETSREHRSLPVFPKWLPLGSLFFVFAMTYGAFYAHVCFYADSQLYSPRTCDTYTCD